MDWKGNAAKNYEIGRPIDKDIVLKIFKKIEEATKESYNGKTIVDAGCGTGRITFLFAKNQPKLQVVGIDKSKEMLGILRKKITKSGIKNYKARYADLLSLDFRDNTFDYSLISSVLHSVKEWKKTVEEIARVTKNQGYIILLSEESDIYNIGLGRVKSKNNGLLENFWGKYIELRKEEGLENPESSQIGLKWQLGLPEAISYIEQRKLGRKIYDFEIEWKKEYTVTDFLGIVEARAWSSMFTANQGKYSKVVKEIKKWSKLKLPLKKKCLSKNIVRCEIIKIVK